MDSRCASLRTSRTCFEHHLSEDGNDPAVFFDGNPLNHHVLPLEVVCLIDFRNAGFRHDVHPRIFHHFRAMPADLRLGIQFQKRIRRVY